MNFKNRKERLLGPNVDHVHGSNGTLLFKNGAKFFLIRYYRTVKLEFYHGSCEAQLNYLTMYTSAEVQDYL